MRFGSSEVLVIHISRGMCLMQFLSLEPGIPPVLGISENAFAIFTFLESRKNSYPEKNCSKVAIIIEKEKMVEINKN